MAGTVSFIFINYIINWTVRPVLERTELSVSAHAHSSPG